MELIKKAFPNRFIAARATRLPVLGNALDRWLFEGDDLIYLPSDRVIPINQPLEMPRELVLPSQAVEHFIEKASTHWLMNRCICRDASACAHYPADLGCLFLGQAASGINPQLGRPVTKDEALAHVQRCREAGLVHLIGRNKLDTLWLGVGPGNRLLTVCNCCPCCCLWRVLPHVADRVSAKITRLPGLTVQVTASCVGCEICTDDVCFVHAIHMRDGLAVIGEACRGCGRCVAVCPQDAIQITLGDSRFVAQAIARIAPLVDLS